MLTGSELPPVVPLLPPALLSALSSPTPPLVPGGLWFFLGVSLGVTFFWFSVSCRILFEHRATSLPLKFTSRRSSPLDSGR